MRSRFALVVLLACASGAASAQPLYRWTDEKGRVHITDTPPPASARSVQQAGGRPQTSGEAQLPYELSLAMKAFPVTLYTSPGCKTPCEAARTLLNKRAVPFKEVQVWDEPSNEELKRVSGSNDVPTLVVGRSVHRGYEPNAYQTLLDSARYPKEGALPPRAQAAPPPPQRQERTEDENAAPARRGPYAPR
jgi:glutaredoxin